MHWQNNAVCFQIFIATISFLAAFQDFSSAENSCSTNQFKCNSSSACVELAWKCDGDNDCEDGSDEENCPAITCASGKFQCADGTDCLDKEWRCDGDADCDDGSDELNCPKKTCKENEFKCATSEKCIEEGYRCDGDPDCDDKSDEENCPTKPPPTEETSECPLGHKVCRRGYGNEKECILLSWVCDGDEDCPDGSDEHNCHMNRCEPNEYACDMHHCIAKSRVCDGTMDCRTGLDEKDCLIAGCNITTSYLCNDGSTCIGKHQLCDGRNDCPNKDDEERGSKKCFYDECQQNNGNCSHICINDDFNRRCECSSGYELAENGQDCIDINECHTDTSNCQQRCINLKGSFRCKCYHGYEQQENGNCKLSKEFDSEGLANVVSLVVANKHDIREINLNSGRTRKFMSVLTRNLTYAAGLTLDVEKRLLYWSDVHRETIKSISLAEDHSPNATTIVSGKANIRSSYGISMDWVNNHLYWVDYSMRKISVCFGNGSHPTTIVDDSGINPHSIVVHPGKGYMFIAASTEQIVFIRRYNMDGSNKLDIVTDDIGMVHGMAIDYDEDRLFWTDEKLHLLASCDLDGKNRKNILESVYFFRFPAGIAVFYDYVYWTDRESRMLRSCNKWSGKKMRTIDRQLIAPYALRIDHPHAQPQYSSPCTGHNCQYLCLPSPNAQKRYTCVCPNGYVGTDDTDIRCMSVRPPLEGPDNLPISQTEPTLETDKPTLTSTFSAPEIEKTSSSFKPETDKPALTSTFSAPEIEKTSSSFKPDKTAFQQTANPPVGPSSSSHASVIIGVGVTALVLLTVVALFAYRFYRRQSPVFNIKVENAIYRKTTPDSAQDDIERKDSQALLVINESQPVSEDRERRNSTDSSSPGGSHEHVYKSIAKVPTESDNTSQIYVNLSDEKRLVEI